MGYETMFNLETNLPYSAQNSHVADTLESITGLPEHWITLMMSRDGYEFKWYSYQTDLEELSRRYPFTVFALHGVGEDKDDQWVLYARNGMSYRLERPRWIIPAFDATNLT